MKKTVLTLVVSGFALSTILALAVNNRGLKRDLETTQEQLKVTYDSYLNNKKLVELRKGFISDNDWVIMVDEKENKVYIRNSDDKQLEIKDFGKYKEVGVK